MTTPPKSAGSIELSEPLKLPTADLTALKTTTSCINPPKKDELQINTHVIFKHAIVKNLLLFLLHHSIKAQQLSHDLAWLKQIL
jgi:hypothetical protein